MDFRCIVLRPCGVNDLVHIAVPDGSTSFWLCVTVGVQVARTNHLQCCIRTVAISIMAFCLVPNVERCGTQYIDATLCLCHYTGSVSWCVVFTTSIVWCGVASGACSFHRRLRWLADSILGIPFWSMDIVWPFKIVSRQGPSSVVVVLIMISPPFAWQQRWIAVGDQCTQVHLVRRRLRSICRNSGAFYIDFGSHHSFIGSKGHYQETM